MKTAQRWRRRPATRIAALLAAVLSAGALALAAGGFPASAGPAVSAPPATREAAAHATAFTSLCGAMAGSGPSTVRHVMIIVDENRSYPQIFGNPAVLGDPYINKVLRPSCGRAGNYHGYSHPSLPNYLALTSGKAEGIAAYKDCSEIVNCPQPQPSIFSQLGSAGRPWREYAESMPARCYPSDSGLYLVRHAPPPYYTTSPVPSECPAEDLPLGTATSGPLAAALSPSADKLPAFSFVTPNACNDMHNCSVSAGDAWLKTWIPLIQRSAAYQSGQLVVFIVWDEGRGADKTPGEHCWDSAHANKQEYPSCWVPLMVISPYTSPGTVAWRRFNARNLLATVEDLLGLARLPSTAGYASMAPSFGL